MTRLLTGRDARVMIESKSGLAKFLAKENLSVVHSVGANTASFSPATRLLTLPVLAEMTGFIYDAFIGHEISHALYTTQADTERFVKSNPEIPFPLVNIVEDARIEKLIQRKYTGLREDFRKFYSYFADYKNTSGCGSKLDFFGLKELEGKDLQKELTLGDRLNLHFKIGKFFRVPFTKEELWAVKALESLETWSDVEKATKDIWSFMKQNPESQGGGDQSQQQQQNGQGGGKAKITITNKGDSSSGQGSSLTDIPEDTEVEVEFDIDENATDSGDQSSKQPGQNVKDALASALQKLQEATGSTQKNFDKAFTDRVFMANSDVKSTFCGHISKLRSLKSSLTDIQSLAISRSNTKTQEMEYRDFSAYFNPIINLMVSQFNTKKAADDYRRTKLAQTGKLNTKKLASCMVSDSSAAFLQNEVTPESENHGIVMMVDLSGSMSGVYSAVMSQVYVMAEFCRKTNVAFEVYGFTSGYNGTTWSTADTTGWRPEGGTIVYKLAGSDVTNRSMYNKLMTSLTQAHPSSIGINMSGTPLSSAVLIMDSIISEFKQKYNRQKNSVLLITDGQAGDSLLCGSSRSHRGAGVNCIILDDSSMKHKQFIATGECMWHEFMGFIANKHGMYSNNLMYITDSTSYAQTMFNPHEDKELSAEISEANTKFVKEKYATLKKLKCFDLGIMVSPHSFNINKSDSLAAVDSFTDDAARQKALSKQFSSVKEDLIFLKFLIDLIS